MWFLFYPIMDGVLHPIQANVSLNKFKFLEEASTKALFTLLRGKERQILEGPASPELQISTSFAHFQPELQITSKSLHIVGVGRQGS